jgi:FkbM family methyltransferase
MNKLLTIGIIDTIGLQYDGNTLSKKGLGGSESAVILMAKELSKIGFTVFVFNDCNGPDIKPGNYDGVIYVPLNNAADYTIDIMIASRTISPFAPQNIKHLFKNNSNIPDLSNMINHAKKKIVWLHDTFVDGDQFLEDFVERGLVDEVFTLSDFHTTYITNCDHGDGNKPSITKKRNFEILKNKIFQTRNGIVKHLDWIDISKKDRDLFVYNASVSKGMIPLVTEIWPKIKENIPTAKLKIIGGYYRFKDSIPDAQEEQFHQLADNNPDIEFTGIIKQNEIAEILSKASYMLYPASFPETFGISSLESLYYRTPLITCRFGALEETAIDLACYKIPYAIEPNSLFPRIDKEWQNNIFVRKTLDAYYNPYLHQQKMYACKMVDDICTWDTVALQWKQHFYRILGLNLSVEEFRKVSKINSRVVEVFGRRFLNKEDTLNTYNPEKKIVVLSPIYNGQDYIGKCIESVVSQDYDNYEMVIINDCSTDETECYISSVLNDLSPSICNKIKIVNNAEHSGSAVYAQMDTIKEFYSNEDCIFILLDGDDWLVNNPNIFKKINDYYHNGAEFTYGSCWSVCDNIPLIAQDYPPDVKICKDYRNYPFNWGLPYTHLRTFSSSLMKNIDYSVFKDEDGKWLKAGGDVAVFYILIERANPDNVVCVPDILVNYNDANPLNDYKVNSEEQTKNAKLYSTKKDNMKKKILIAIPTNKNIEPTTFKAIYDLIVPDGYETTFQYFHGYVIDQIRNLICDWSVRNGFDYVLCVDSDISFEPDTLVKMLSHNVDMVTGVYRQRLPNSVVEIYDTNLQHMPYDKVISKPFQKIGACGFGCVLVKTSVFTIIGYPQFKYHSALDHSNTFSEDIDFCKKANEKGIIIYCDSTIRCGHWGTVNYSLDDIKIENSTLKRLKELRAMDLLPQDHSKFLQTLKDKGVYPHVIYDLGSCVMHWTDRARKVWGDANYCLVEAMEAVEDLYKETDVVYAISVLSDSIKEVEFYENTYDPGGNSYYKENTELSPRALELFPESSKSIRRANTLDNIVKEKGWSLPDLIKMDIQGAELDVLKGASETLKNCKHLILELQHVDYNQGAPKKDEVIEYLKSLGYKTNGMFCGSVLGVDGDYYFYKD